MVTPCIPSCRYGGPGATEEGAAEEAKKILNHTFTSYSRPSASRLLEVLIARVVGCEPARSSCDVILC
jgi:hypothetical protein